MSCLRSPVGPLWLDLPPTLVFALKALGAVRAFASLSLGTVKLKSELGENPSSAVIILGGRSQAVSSYSK